jgi:hypothetical protein
VTTYGAGASAHVDYPLTATLGREPLVRMKADDGTNPRFRGLLYGTDPDGRCPPCVGALIGGVVGGAVGGIAEGGWSAASQYIQNGSVDWKEVGADAAGGAVSGAIIGGVTGGTGGLSLFAEAGVSAAANAVGGEVTGLIEGKDTSASDVIEDAAVGYAGGTIGHIAADLASARPSRTEATKQPQELPEDEKVQCEALPTQCSQWSSNRCRYSNWNASSTCCE